MWSLNLQKLKLAEWNKKVDRLKARLANTTRRKNYYFASEEHEC